VKNNTVVHYVYMRLVLSGVLKDFVKKGDSQLTKVKFCSWINRNKKPLNKEKYCILFYCINNLRPSVYFMSTVLNTYKFCVEPTSLISVFYMDLRKKWRFFSHYNIN
jgi:hypothetical protein